VSFVLGETTKLRKMISYGSSSRDLQTAEGTSSQQLQQGKTVEIF